LREAPTADVWLFAPRHPTAHFTSSLSSAVISLSQCTTSVPSSGVALQSAVVAQDPFGNVAQLVTMDHSPVCRLCRPYASLSQCKPMPRLAHMTCSVWIPRLWAARNYAYHGSVAVLDAPGRHMRQYRFLIFVSTRRNCAMPRWRSIRARHGIVTPLVLGWSP